MRRVHAIKANDGMPLVSQAMPKEHKNKETILWRRVQEKARTKERKDMGGVWMVRQGFQTLAVRNRRKKRGAFL